MPQNRLERHPEQSAGRLGAGCRHDRSRRAQGAVGPAEFGDLRLTAAEFAKLLDDLRQSRSSNAATAATRIVPDPVAETPPPSGFKVENRGRLDGDMGENPQNAPGEYQQAAIDWPAWQCATAVAGDRWIISNRFQVSAFNIKSGQYEWRAMLGGEQASAHDWPLSPMRPLVTAERVFVRRLTKQGPVLAALELASGKVLWSSRPEPEKSILSDPVLVEDQLFVVVGAEWIKNISCRWRVSIRRRARRWARGRWRDFANPGGGRKAARSPRSTIVS